MKNRTRFVDAGAHMNKKISKRERRWNADWAAGRRAAVLADIDAMCVQEPPPNEQIAAGARYLKDKGDRASAIAVLEKAAPAARHADLAALLGEAFAEEGRFEDAAGVVERALADGLESGLLFDVRGRLVFRENRFEESVPWFEKAVAAAPREAMFLARLAEALQRCERLDEATAAAKRAVALAPANPALHRHLGILSLIVGDLALAEGSFRRSLQMDPGHPRSVAGLLTATRNAPASLLRAQVEALTRRAATTDNPLLLSRHQDALAQTLERLGEDAHAFEAFRKAAAHRKTVWTSDEVGARAAHWEHTRSLGPDKFAREDYASSCPFSPLFIVGLPRSGTTLMETIFGAYDGARSVGEKTYVDDVDEAVSYEDQRASLIARMAADAPGASIVATSAPENFWKLAHIRKLLPEAVIIWMLRHPMANGWSCFRADFASGGLNWTDSFDDIAKVRALHDRAGRFYAEKLSDPLIFVGYEDLVENFRNEMGRILESCGLAWRDELADFHKKSATVRSASVAQVREPIHTRAADAWKRYEDFLTPLAEAYRAEGVELSRPARPK